MEKKVLIADDHAIIRSGPKEVKKAISDVLPGTGYSSLTIKEHFPVRKSSKPPARISARSGAPPIGWGCLMILEDNEDTRRRSRGKWNYIKTKKVPTGIQ